MLCKPATHRVVTSARILPPARAARFSAAVLLATVVLLTFAVSAFAAPTFSAQTPASGSTTATARPQISVQIYDALKINKTLTTMKVDNVSVTATFTYTSGDQKNASLAYTKPTDMSIGVHTVKVTSYNQSNQPSTTTWNFTVVAAPPVLSNPVPAADSVITTTTPVIACLASAGYTGMSATATVDGRSVTAQIGGSTPPTVTVVSLSGLANDTTHTIAVTANGPGGRTTLTWAFRVQLYPPMPDADCVVCHTAMPAAHDTGSPSSCALCHAPTAPIGGGYTASQYPTHTPTMLSRANCTTCHMVGHWPSVPAMHSMNAQDAYHTPVQESACKICHAEGLSNEHARYSVTATTTSPIPGGATGGAFSCATCHTSTDPTVVAAIGTALSVPGSGNNACVACHATAGHSSDHPVTPDAFCAKAGCHVATTLTDEHIDAPLVPAHARTCETCHLSTDSTVTATIAAKDSTCEHCHGTKLVSGHEVMHSYVMSSECAYCHTGSIAAEHLIRHNPSGATDCYTCHHSIDSTIVAAIASGPPGRECPVCHTDSGHQAVHGADFSGQTAPGSDDCADCHASNLQTEHLKVTSKDHESKCYHCHKTPAAGDDTFAAIEVLALNGQPWNQTCSVGNCHKLATNEAVHADIDASHTLNPANAACLASGCHAADGLLVFEGKTLDEIHSAATTVVAGSTRAGCLVCHNNPNVPNTGGIPTSTDCLTCHPERANSHGYDSAKHTGNPTAQVITIDGMGMGSHACGECHQVELKTEHEANATIPVGRTVCSLCHPTLKATLTPSWDKTLCAQGGCHTTGSTAPMHSNVDTDHVIPSVTCTASGCHTGFANVAQLHAAESTIVGGTTYTSCQICHAGVVTPRPTAVCSTCHDATITGVDGHKHPGQDASHTASVTSGTMVVSSVSYGTFACAQCHASNDIAEVHGDTCTTCHPMVVSEVSPWSALCTACHAGGAIKLQHGSIDSSHTRLSANDGCFTGCHHTDGNLAAIHSAATTTVGGSVRASCLVCHNNPNVPNSGGVPTDGNCLTCHPERVNEHGYSAAVHTSTETCVGTCHPTELKPAHDAAISGDFACTRCHDVLVDAVTPWQKTCVAECHPTIAHTSAGTNHVGTDAVAAARYPNYGCSPNADHIGCHGTADLSAIHRPGDDKGCPVCHGTIGSPKKDCGLCHEAYGATEGMPPTGPQKPDYNDANHHYGAGYLNNRADAGGLHYFWADWAPPPNGWYGPLFDHDCQLCHNNIWGTIEYGPYGGSRMWNSITGGYTVDERTLTIDAMTLGSNPALTFMTRYNMGGAGSSIGYVQVSTNGGSTWTNLSGIAGGSGPAITQIEGTIGSWTSMDYSLSAYAGQTVKLRFRYTTDGNNDSSGWSIDNISVTDASGTRFSDDSETANAKITSYRWARTEGAVGYQWNDWFYLP
jgi:methionine-rich copper-binding protein CopC